MEILSKNEETASTVGYIDLSQRNLAVIPQFIMRFKVCFLTFQYIWVFHLNG